MRRLIETLDVVAWVAIVAGLLVLGCAVLERLG